MRQFKCPHCGNYVEPPKNTGLAWGIGCLVAFLVIPVIIAVIGLLAAIALPSFAKARETAQTHACINNLRVIEATKDQLAIETNLNDGAEVDTLNLQQMVSNPDTLSCPTDGIYTLHPIGIPAECSIHGSPASL